MFHSVFDVFRVIRQACDYAIHGDGLCVTMIGYNGSFEFSSADGQKIHRWNLPENASYENLRYAFFTREWLLQTIEVLKQTQAKECKINMLDTGELLFSYRDARIGECQSFKVLPMPDTYHNCVRETRDALIAAGLKSW